LSDWLIPLCDLDYGPEEEAAVLRVLRSRWLSMGPEVQKFEEEFADYIGTRHALAVANGTAALHLAYLALGLGPGDEVIQPAINFVAAANMTVAVGATPVFADIIGLEEPTIDPDDIARKVTGRTKAVVVMHYGGYLCRMAEIRELCQKHGLLLIEDACHAVGGSYLNPMDRTPHVLKAGNLSDLACFSFFSNKNMATGEGGMITTNRDELNQRLRLLRSHGMSTLTWDRHRGHASFYEVSAHGYNYRLDEIHAALGRCQLVRLDGNTTRREELVAAYHSQLNDLPRWVIPFADYAGESAYHLMIAVAPSVELREEAAGRLRSAGIQTSLHYPLIPAFEVFARFPTPRLEASEHFAHRTITLPLFPTMTLDQVDAVCANLQGVALRRASRAAL